jgi:hypothetical protein
MVNAGVGSVPRDPLDAARSRAVVAGYSGCLIETGLGGACPTSRALLAPVMPARTDRASKANTIVFIGCGSICKHDPDNTHCCSSLAPTWAPGPSPRCAAGHSSAQSGATYCAPCPNAGHRRDRGAAAELASQGLGTLALPFAAAIHWSSLSRSTHGAWICVAALPVRLPSGSLPNPPPHRPKTSPQPCHPLSEKNGGRQGLGQGRGPGPCGDFCRIPFAAPTDSGSLPAHNSGKPQP